VSYTVIAASDHAWEDRPSLAEGAPRATSDVTTAAGLTQSRARLWRLPPGARGRRHAEGAQEEVFVVLQGTLTMLLGEPPERVALPPHSIARVEPGTPLQARNESGEDVLVFAYGAPPATGQTEFLDDVEL
jgi:mannose-6-phosphate isomerase-like protein (cupin superfamily)